MQALVKGDMNADGLVDNEDIDGFVSGLIDIDGFQANTGLTDGVARGDLSGDTLFDNEDIQPFVNALLGLSPSAVPEPSTWVLLALGAVCGVRPALRRSRRA